MKVEKDGFQFFAEDFEMESGGTQAIKATLEPTFTNATLNAPAFKQWMKEVAALPPGRQVEAVAKKLREFNPGFDGNVTPKIENGVVAELYIMDDEVTDISPIRALVNLKHLKSSGKTKDGKLSDLSPLQGMSLNILDVSWTKVADLSPLREMPLTEFTAGARVSDLSPLRNAPLARLLCDGSAVVDLSPLAGMNLIDFQFTPRSIIKGLDVVRQMKSIKWIGTSSSWSKKWPPAEFWKKYDAGEFGKPAATSQARLPRPAAFQQWMKATQALPAEKQMEAVAKKLHGVESGV